MANDAAQKCRYDPGDPFMVRPLSLTLYPDPLLRALCCPVERFDSGLSAPQVGITQRLFVAEIQGYSVCLANPVITGLGGSERMAEGCLSLPGVSVDVQRNRQVEVQGYDVHGRRRNHRVGGLWARVMQHEIDHLDGVLICDHEAQGGRL